MDFVRSIYSFWEVSDNLSKEGYSAVVGLALPQMKSGEPGKIMTSVIREVVDSLRSGEVKKAILSNRWPVKTRGISLAELEREVAISLGADPRQIILPQDPREPSIRNTRKEAEFALEQVKLLGGDSLLIVANHLHMRRTIATFKKVFEGSGIRLYWKSVGSSKDYGLGYSQARFSHPTLFFCYEIVAIAVSRQKGWV